MLRKLSSFAVVVLVVLVGCSAINRVSADETAELKQCLKEFIPKLQTIEIPEQVSKLVALVQAKNLDDVYAVDVIYDPEGKLTDRLKGAFDGVDDKEATMDSCLSFDATFIETKNDASCQRHILELDAEIAAENKNMLGADNLVSKFNRHRMACVLLNNAMDLVQ